MQMHKLQFAIIKRVNTSLNRDLDKLMLGSMLPNLTKYEHSLSHFRGEEIMCDVHAFVRKYNDKLNNDVVLGYFMHLLIDNFYKDFMNTQILTYNEEDKKVDGYIFNGIKKTGDLDTIKKLVKQDYQLYSIYLMNNGLVDKFSSDECVKDVVELDECKVDSNTLYDTVISHNLDMEKNKKKKFMNRFKKYKVLNREMYDDLVNKCVDNILSIVKTS